MNYTIPVVNFVIYSDNLISKFASTDAGLVGRNVMSQQQRWPKNNTQEELEHKLGESIWWLTVLADRMGLNIKEVTENFLSKTEKLL